MKHPFLSIICLFIVFNAANARMVTGEVTCQGKGISKVIVTDGESFTMTSAGGKFSFDIDDDAEFVYIVTPSGYVADWSKGSPEFYQKAEGRRCFTFNLQKTDSGKKEYNLIVVGDPQTKTAHFEEFIVNPLNDICRTVSSLSRPTIGIVVGDICYDVLPLQKRWKEEILRTGIPFYPSVGNHDHDKAFNDDELSIHAYRENFGPENYAFFLGKDLFIVLDNIIYHSQRSYEEGYTDETIGWVSGLMKMIDKNTDIFVVQHSSLNGRWHRTSVHEPVIVNCDKLIDLLDNHTVTFLSGHNHVNGNFQYGPKMTEHNLAAICGTWWDTYHCTDGTPRGYKVYTKKRGKLSWYYKSVDKDPEFQYEIFMPGTTRLHPEHLVVNIWDYDQNWSTVWFEDGKRMGPMEQVEEYSPIHSAEIHAKYDGTGKRITAHRMTGCADHYFAAKPSENAKEITIMIRNPFGRTWKETVRLKN